MVRESGISATKPIFPSYLLPSLKLPFLRRSSASSSGSSGGSSTATACTSPSTSPPDDKAGRLGRLAPDTLRCTSCSADVAFATQIISKGFTGRYGRALLVAPPNPGSSGSLQNIRIGRSENRQLVTGWHVVADITCGSCSKKLGWKYVDAKEKSQKYKVGKYILETERVMTYRTWGNMPADQDGLVDEYAYGTAAEGREESPEVSFDSDDEDECEDVFAGVWDAQAVAKRRNQMLSRQLSEAE